MSAPATAPRWSRPAADAMTEVELFMVGGTWNPRGDGVTHAFLDRLIPSIRVTWVDYPASPEFGTSVPAGEYELVGKIAESRARFKIAAGYSQGALVAANVASRPSLHPLDLCAVIADPLRAEGSRALNGLIGGYGILGSREVKATPLVQVAAPGDPIAALIKGSPLRSLGDGIRDGQRDMDAWAQALLSRARQRGFQQWWQPAYWQDWAGATGWAANYFTGRHTDAYVREGLCALLAHEVNKRAIRAMQ